MISEFKRLIIMSSKKLSINFLMIISLVSSHAGLT